MIEQIENQTETNVLTGEVECPLDRAHLFSTHSNLCDFVKAFNINNYTVRYGQTSSGKWVYQLVYSVAEN